jgi:hypothetical protein
MATTVEAGGPAERAATPKNQYDAMLSSHIAEQKWT